MNPLPQTPSQTVGPFLGIGLIHGENQNVLADERTAGKRIRLVGVVYDGNGNPIEDASSKYGRQMRMAFILTLLIPATARQTLTFVALAERRTKMAGRMSSTPSNLVGGK